MGTGGDRRFTYDTTALPLRVEAALLHLYYGRTSWFKNIVPFDAVVAHYQRFAGHMRDRAARPDRSGARPPGAWAKYIASADGARDFQARYVRWRGRAQALTQELTTLDRSAPLSPARRAHVLETFAEASMLHARVSRHDMNWWRADRVAKLSLTELLLAHPEIARRHPGEVAAARPSDSCEHCHKMLGPGRRVQQAVPSNAQAVVLL